MTVKAKTFIHVLSRLHLNRKLLYTFLEDKRLTQNEKTILRCMGYLREAKFQEIVDTLEALGVQTDEVVESQRLLVLGMAYNNKGDSAKAPPLLSASANLAQKSNLTRQIFLAYYNLFIAHSNMKNQHGMAEALDKIPDFISPDDFTEEICLIRCRLIYASFIEDYQKALVHLKALNQFRDRMGAHLVMVTVNDEFNLWVKMENWTKCKSLLEEFKNHRSFNFGANYKFMKSMLLHISEDKPLYVYDQDFLEFPVLLHQMKTIRALEEGKQNDATVNWKKLQGIAPEIYQDSFVYKGDKCLFSIALLKHTEKKGTLDLAHLPQQKDMALLQILKQSEVPLSQEFIHQALWGKAPEEKSDLNKLSRLVSRTNKKWNLEIKFKKGCYFLQDLKKAKSA